VASAGCTIIRRVGPGTLAYESGGLFLSATHERQNTLSEPDYHSVFPQATYAVAGNTVRLLTVRNDIWHAVGGFDASKATDLQGEAEYGERAITNGYVHYATSAVSAILDVERDQDSPGTASTTISPSVFSSSTTIVQTLVG
jgi:hypothetical protein